MTTATAPTTKAQTARQAWERKVKSWDVWRMFSQARDLLAKVESVEELTDEELRRLVRTKANALNVKEAAALLRAALEQVLAKK